MLHRAAVILAQGQCHEMLISAYTLPAYLEEKKKESVRRERGLEESTAVKAVAKPVLAPQ